MKGKKGLIGAAVLLAVLGWTIYQRQGVPILDEDTKNRLTCVLDYRNGIYAEWKGKGYVSHGSGYQDLQGGVFGEQDVTERVDRERLLDLLAVHQRRRGRFEKSDRIFIDGAQIEICGVLAYCLVNAALFIRKRETMCTNIGFWTMAGF